MPLFTRAPSRTHTSTQRRAGSFSPDGLSKLVQTQASVTHSEMTLDRSTVSSRTAETVRPKSSSDFNDWKGHRDPFPVMEVVSSRPTCVAQYSVNVANLRASVDLESILATLEYNIYPWNEEYVTAAGVALVKQIANDETKAAQLARLGGCETVSSALSFCKPSTTPECVQALISSVMWLAHGNEARRSALALSGANKSVVTNLNVHMLHEGVVEAACGAVLALSNPKPDAKLTFDSSDNCCGSLADSGVCESLARTLKAHMGKASIVEVSCGAIASVAANSDAARAALATAQAPAFVALALRVHVDHPGVVTQACLCIVDMCAGMGTCAGGTANRNAFLALNSPSMWELLLQAKRVHPSSRYIDAALETVA